MLEYSIAAAGQAAALHAYHEAAAQYARALRFADHLPGPERARFYEGRSIACYLSEQGEEAMRARQAALAIWRTLGDPLKEGRISAGSRTSTGSRDAVWKRRQRRPPRWRCWNLCRLGRSWRWPTVTSLSCGCSTTISTARSCGVIGRCSRRGASRNHETLVTPDQRWFGASLRWRRPGVEELARSLQLALEHGLLDHAARALNNLAWMAMLVMRLDEADRQFATGLAFAIEHDLDHATGFSWRGGRRSESVKVTGMLGNWNAAGCWDSRCYRR